MGGEWAIVEVMGRRQYSGEVSEVVVAGIPLLRVSVPASVSIVDVSTYGTATDPNGDGYTVWLKTMERHYDPLVVDLGGGAVFAITRCTEERARAALDDSTRGEVVKTVESEWRRRDAHALPGPIEEAEVVDEYGTHLDRDGEE